MQTKNDLGGNLCRANSCGRNLSACRRRALNPVARCAAEKHFTRNKIGTRRRRALINDSAVLYRRFIRTICNSGLCENARWGGHLPLCGHLRKTTRVRVPWWDESRGSVSLFTVTRGIIDDTAVIELMLRRPIYLCQDSCPSKAIKMICSEERWKPPSRWPIDKSIRSFFSFLGITVRIRTIIFRA